MKAKVKTKSNYRGLNGHWLPVYEIRGTRVTLTVIDEIHGEIHADFTLSEIVEFSHTKPQAQKEALTDAKLIIERLQTKFITMDKSHDNIQAQTVRTLGKIEAALKALPPLSPNTSPTPELPKTAINAKKTAQSYLDAYGVEAHGKLAKIAVQHISVLSYLAVGKRCESIRINEDVRNMDAGDIAEFWGIVGFSFAYLADKLKAIHEMHLQKSMESAQF